MVRCPAGIPARRHRRRAGATKGSRGRSKIRPRDAGFPGIERRSPAPGFSFAVLWALCSELWEGRFCRCSTGC